MSTSIANNLGINIKARQDYSTLFSSLSTKSSSNSMSLDFLSDYASIKNGSYGKLLNAYYAKDRTGTSASSSTSTAADSASVLSKVESDAEALKKSADSLITKGTKSLFKEIDITTTDESGVSKTSKGYDKDAIYKAVASFVSDYNSLIDSTGKSNTTSITSRTASMENMTNSNKNILSKMGITIGSDNKLSIDEKTFKSADMTSVKSLFNGTGSYAYQVSAQASMIDYSASQEANKSNTYGSNASYSNNYSAGSLFDGYL